MKTKIKNELIQQLSEAPVYGFPKYTTQVINLVNNNAQGTRADIVGQMSELIKEFDGKTLSEWIEWYTERYPTAVNEATEKIYAKFLEMKSAIDAIDKALIENWVKDLVYTKTFCGLKFQSAIIAYIAEKYDEPWRLANVEEEAKGIDGFIGNSPVQVKSSTYKTEARLSEVIDVPIIYYDKKKDSIHIEYDESSFL